MRARLAKLFPIVLLAVLVQLLAPVGAARMLGATLSDPLHLAGICSELSGTAGSDSGDQHQGHTTCCALCCVAQAIGPAGDPHQDFVILQRAPETIAWRVSAPVWPIARVGTLAQARAPPVFS